MKIQENTLREWASFGFHLGRIGFIWGNPDPQVADACERGKKDIIRKLDGKMVPDEKDKHTFVESILGYFGVHDIQIHDCILIGMCIQRYKLSLEVTSEDTQAMLQKMAQTLVPLLSDELVPDKDRLYEAICSSKDNKMSVVFNKIMEALSA